MCCVDLFCCSVAYRLCFVLWLLVGTVGCDCIGRFSGVVFWLLALGCVSVAGFCVLLRVGVSGLFGYVGLVFMACCLSAVLFYTINSVGHVILFV